jgi:DNA-binding MarR family transcriptional regulator
MSQEDLHEIAEAVAGLFPRLARGLSSAEKDLADDLPLAQLRLCGMLCEGSQPMSALSHALGVSLSALTQIADRLERARLVKRVSEENDRRVRCLQLTAQGEKMMHQRREVRIHRTMTVLEHLAAPQREALLASLEILADACSAVYAAEHAGDRHDVHGGPKPAHGHLDNHHSKTKANKRSPSKATP